jgi:diguanylate cyclase (GGDEF)-like protein
MNKNEDISNLLLSLSKDEYAENRWIVSLENSSLDLFVKDKISLQNKSSNNESAEKIKNILKNPNLLNPVKEIDQQTRALTLNSFLRGLRNEILNSKVNKRDLSLLSLQVDFFDKILEKYGEKLGDAILKRVAHTIETFTRDTDIVARTGKCKFSIIMTGTNNSGLHTAMNKLKRILNKQIPRDMNKEHSPTITITASLGGLHITSKIIKHIEPNYVTISSIIDLTNSNLDSAITSGGNKAIATEMELSN